MTPSKPSPLVREASGQYQVIGSVLSEADILHEAEAIIERRFFRQAMITNSEDAIHFLQAKLACLDHEVFGALFLDNKHQVLCWEVLFTGTIDGCTIHPREVVKRALAHNAAAIIFAHPHPSGCAKASQADIRITERLKKALALVDVRVLDHIVIGGNKAYSMAEEGCLTFGPVDFKWE